MSDSKPKILILFYSMYGHIYRMAQAVAEGVREAGGEPVLMQVEELMPEEYWDENVKRAKEFMKNIPFADPRADYSEFDGFIIGTPTRFGNMTAQVRNFWDQTSDSWMKGSFVGKAGSVFTSSATQHGGQETTIISAIYTLLHQGFVFVGLPYKFQEQMRTDEITGGSPYGASTITGGMGERMPSENELLLARHLGRHHTEIAFKLKIKPETLEKVFEKEKVGVET
jgi:NAD(P)H dehydrogenase (quinone)